MVDEECSLMEDYLSADLVSGELIRTRFVPDTRFGSTVGSEATSGAIPGACAPTALTPGTKEGPVVRRGGATMRVAQVSLETMAPVTPDPTGGISGALTLGMPRGLTSPAGAGRGTPRYHRRC